MVIWHSLIELSYTNSDSRFRLWRRDIEGALPTPFLEDDAVATCSLGLS